jgi:hypothetical protein
MLSSHNSYSNKGMSMTDYRMVSRVLVSVLLFISVTGCTGAVQTASTEAPLAFPGAEGFGANSIGGRGGAVYEVTNLDDSGPGSLRAACLAKGPRTIVFRVSGTIKLASRLTIREPYITIAGQTAPGDGICVRDEALMITTHDVIVRYIRSRIGNALPRSTGDAMDVMRGSKDVILDHCSISWGTDESGSFYGNTNVTIQWCMIGECFFGHSCGGLWGPESSYHHNLLYSNGTRNPKFAYARPDTVSDFRNNVIYNWGYQSSIAGGNDNVNIINNYYKYGPGRDSNDPLSWKIVGIVDMCNMFVAGNYVWGFPKVSADNWAGGVQGAKCNRVDKPFLAPPVTMQSAEKAYELVLANVGAVKPKRDPVDVRVIEQVRTRTSTFASLKEGKLYAGIPDSIEKVGGWPELRTYDVQADSDHDGMPDAWEKANGLDPANAEDRNGHKMDKNYTNLEVYLSSLCPDPFKIVAQK